MTGASFLVLNGALKSSSGLTAKSSIVEDGMMVQVSQDRMMEIRKAINNMQDVTINCGPVAADKPDEVVVIKWADRGQLVNSGYAIQKKRSTKQMLSYSCPVNYYLTHISCSIKSWVDGRSMEGIPSVRMMHSGPDYTSKNHLIRWTEVYVLPNTRETDPSARSTSSAEDFLDPPDPTRITSHIAKAVSIALLPHLKHLKSRDLSPVAVRVCLDPENVNF